MYRKSPIKSIGGGEGVGAYSTFKTPEKGLKRKGPDQRGVKSSIHDR